MNPIETFSAVPAAVMMLGALVLPLAPRRFRSVLFLCFPIAVFVLMCRMESGAGLVLRFLDYDLVVTRTDRLSFAFGYVFTIVALLGGLYSFHLDDSSQQTAALFYGGSALGVVFAGDWLTLYVFWEIMAISSVWLVWSSRSARSARAGMRYLLFHFFGGMVLLAGILWHVSETGSLLFGGLESSGAAMLILFGFAVNAAVPPLHAWLVDAYPEATITGSVFLSAFTTKAAVYVLARGFPGWELLVTAGTIMALYGVVFAFLENDIRRILAYHIISQVGYMVAGIGLGTEAAINGSTAHAFAHILYKGQLFMATGAVIFATGRRKLTDLGGLAGELPWVLMLYMIAALSISSFPLFSGFVSKALVIHAAEIDHREWLVLLLQTAAVGTFLSVGLKLPYFTWFGGAPRSGVVPLPKGMYIAMGLAAAMNVAIGIAPDLLYRILPYPVEYQPYTAVHLLETFEILGFTGLVFWFLRGRILPKAALTLDLDWFYRRPAPWLWQHIVLGVDRLFGVAENATRGVVHGVARLSGDPVAFGRRTAAPGDAADVADGTRAYDPDRYRAPIGTLIVAVLLGFVLLLSWNLAKNAW